MSENFPTHALIPQILLVNGHRFRYGVNVNDTWGETLLEFLRVLWGDGFFWLQYHQGKEAVRGGS